jgi:hypothetical protein
MMYRAAAMVPAGGVSLSRSAELLGKAAGIVRNKLLERIVATMCQGKFLPLASRIARQKLAETRSVISA